MVERIRSLLAKFPEDDTAVRGLVASDDNFIALCQEYRKVIELLDRFDTEVERFTQLRVLTEVARLTQLRASLEEELLSRIEGYEPH